jgi:hypothetical protein
MKKPDNRYRIGREWCGYATARWVARFCDEWIGQGKTRAEAARLCNQHRMAFAKSLGIAA